MVNHCYLHTKDFVSNGTTTFSDTRRGLGLSCKPCSTSSVSYELVHLIFLNSKITREIAIRYGGTHTKAWHTNWPLCVNWFFSLTSIYDLLSEPGWLPPMMWAHTLLLSKKDLHGWPITIAVRVDISKNSQLSHKPWDIVWPTAPLDCSLGFMKNLSYGLIIILGQTMKVTVWVWTFSTWELNTSEVLTWVSIYWFSRSGPAASVRIYYEVVNSSQGFINPSPPPTIPMGCSLFPKEIGRIPSRYVIQQAILFHIWHILPESIDIAGTPALETSFSRQSMMPVVISLHMNNPKLLQVICRKCLESMVRLLALYLDVMDIELSKLAMVESYFDGLPVCKA